jgi:hypothetical protein
LAENKRGAGVFVAITVLLAALVGAVAIYSFPRPAKGSTSTTTAFYSGAQLEGALGKSVRAFQSQLMSASQGTGLDGLKVALLSENLSTILANYTRLSLEYNLTFRGISTTFAVLRSELVFMSAESQNVTTTIELNASDGANVCPIDFSGFGTAVWNASSSTCTLTQTNPDVGPTLCLGNSPGGCVTVAALRYKIDSDVTFNLSLTDSAACVYSVLDNYGTVNVAKWKGDVGAGLCNYGIIDNFGTIILNGASDNQPFNGAGVINNFAGGTITNEGTLSNGGTINNFGTFVNTGRLEECIGGSPTVYGLVNFNVIENKGTVYLCPTRPAGNPTYFVLVTASPAGVSPNVYVNGTLHQTPFTFTTGYGDFNNITAAETFGNTPTYHFASWSNGGNRTQEYTTSENSTLTANYSTP